MLSAEYWLQVHQQRHDELAARSDESRRARAISPGTPPGVARAGLRAAVRSATLRVTDGVTGIRATRPEDPLCC